MNCKKMKSSLQHDKRIRRKTQKYLLLRPMFTMEGAKQLHSRNFFQELRYDENNARSL